MNKIFNQFFNLEQELLKAKDNIYEISIKVSMLKAMVDQAKKEGWQHIPIGAIEAILKDR